MTVFSYPLVSISVVVVLSKLYLHDYITFFAYDLLLNRISTTNFYYNYNINVMVILLFTAVYKHITTYARTEVIHRITLIHNNNNVCILTEICYRNYVTQ